MSTPSSSQYRAMSSRDASTPTSQSPSPSDTRSHSPSQTSYHTALSHSHSHSTFSRSLTIDDDNAQPFLQHTQHDPDYLTDDDEEDDIEDKHDTDVKSRTRTRTRRPHVDRTWKEMIINLTRQHGKVCTCACALLVAALGTSISFKKMTTAMPNYPYFLSLITTVVYIPIFMALVWQSHSTITPEMKRYPKWKFASIGLLDALAALLMIYGGVHTAGSTQAVLLNGVLPVTMLLAILATGPNLRVIQYIGVGAVTMGVVTLLCASWVDNSKEDDVASYNTIFLVSVIPQGLSSFFKGIALIEAEMDVNYLQVWVALFQFISSLLLLPLNLVSFLTDHTLSASHLFTAFSDGGRCILGWNTVTPPDCISWETYHYHKHHPIPSCDRCDGAFVPVLLYILFSCMYNFFATLVLKSGSPIVMSIVMTLRLPLVQAAFAMPFISSPSPTDTYSWYNILSFLFVLIGVIAYRWPSPTPSLPEESDTTQDQVLFTLGQLDTGDPSHHSRRSTSVVPTAATTRDIRSTFYASIGVIDSPNVIRAPNDTNQRFIQQQQQLAHSVGSVSQHSTSRSVRQSISRGISDIRTSMSGHSMTELSPSYTESTSMLMQPPSRSHSNRDLTRPPIPMSTHVSPCDGDDIGSINGSIISPSISNPPSDVPTMFRSTSSSTNSS